MNTLEMRYISYMNTRSDMASPSTANNWARIVDFVVELLIRVLSVYDELGIEVLGVRVELSVVFATMASKLYAIPAHWENSFSKLTN